MTLARAIERYHVARAGLAKAYKDTQESCKHELIAEMHVSWMPWRICETCGAEEAHGGFGFKVLTTDRVRPIDSDEFYALRPITGIHKVGRSGEGGSVKCAHREVAEVDRNLQPVLRICTSCGLEEPSKRGRFRILTGAVRQVSIRQFVAIRREFT